MHSDFIRDQHLDSMRVAGKRVAAGVGAAIQVFNPHTNEKLGTVPKATVQEVRNAFRIARGFQPRLTRFERAEILNRAAAIVRQRATDICALITAESGLSLKDSMYETGR